MTSSSRPNGRRTQRKLAFLGVGALGALVLAGGALAYSATSFVNLTTAGAEIAKGDALWIQGGTGAGTGNFDPFLTLSTNADTAKGYNTTPASGEFDTFFGGDRTHPIKASAIPSLVKDGVVYREFSLDANDQGSDDWMSIDRFRVFLDDQNNLTGFNVNTNSFSSDNAQKATLKYDLGDSWVVLMRSQALTPGSGVSDISVLLKDSVFPAECYYGSPTCNLWVYVYTEKGGFDGVGSPVPDKNWNVTAGFEEWRTRLLPVVNVSKTAVTSYTQPYTWTVDKKVKVDGECVDADTVDLFKGDTQTADWCITPTRTAGTPTNPTVSGTITITNPTGGTVISTSIDAEITSVTDQIVQGATTTNATVSCPVSFPYTLKAGETLTCTYSAGVATTTAGTNTASVTLSDNPTPYTGTAAVDFTAATVNEVNENATLTDAAGPLNQPAVSGQTVYVSKTYACDADEGLKSNTATVTPTEGGTPASDTATLTITCHDLTVSKNATTSYTRTFPWTILKSVTPATWNLFVGESGQSQYTVALTKGTGVDSAFAVNGTITVSNPAPISATVNSVSDVVSPSINATVTCPGTAPYTIAAGGSLVCTYSASLPDKTTRTNTATATLQNKAYTSAGVPSNSGTTGFSGSASVTFGAPTTLVNDTVNVTDTVQGSLGAFSASGSTTYLRTFSCGSSNTYDNTASIVETGQSSSARVTVNCYEVTVTKNATTTYERKFKWVIDKDSTDPNGGALTLNPGQTYDYPYRIRVNLDPEAPWADSAFAANGTITVSNPAPIPATINSVSDAIAGGITATVTCPGTAPYEIAAGGSLVCTYSASLPDKTTRVNTATAVRQSYSYPFGAAAAPAGTSSVTGTANVVFGDPTELIDESIMIVDDYGTPADASDDKTFGPVLYNGTLPATFTYDRTFGPYTTAQCGEILVSNTATLTTVDTSTKVSDSWLVTITIPCPEGCTLTQGYWKTHSILGPASKADPTWDLVGGPNAMFYLSGQTWYEVFWTPPKGGNVYYSLAHQFMAAKLNVLSGAATTPAVDAALAWGETFFNTYTPTSNFSKALKDLARSYASTLGSYNEGLIGPGHCSVDSTASSAPTY